MKKEILESLIFFIVALLTFLYVKKHNPDKIIDRYYIANSAVLYNIYKLILVSYFKLSCFKQVR